MLLKQGNNNNTHYGAHGYCTSTRSHDKPRPGHVVLMPTVRKRVPIVSVQIPEVGRGPSTNYLLW